MVTTSKRVAFSCHVASKTLILAFKPQQAKRTVS